MFFLYRKQKQESQSESSGEKKDRWTEAVHIFNLFRNLIYCLQTEDISDTKLVRTDTTLNLSPKGQKAIPLCVSICPP